MSSRVLPADREDVATSFFSNKITTIKIYQLTESIAPEFVPFFIFLTPTSVIPQFPSRAIKIIYSIAFPSYISNTSIRYKFMYPPFVSDAQLCREMKYQPPVLLDRRNLDGSLGSFSSVPQSGSMILPMPHRMFFFTPFAFTRQFAGRAFARKSLSF